MEVLADVAPALLAGLVGLGLGALLERARARSGYLAKRYRDHLEVLTSLAQADDGSDQARALRTQVLKQRAGIEVDVALFGSLRVARRLGYLHDAIASGTTLPASFKTQVEELVAAERGFWVLGLAPQARWFKLK